MSDGGADQVNRYHIRTLGIGKLRGGLFFFARVLCAIIRRTDAGKRIVND